MAYLPQEPVLVMRASEARHLWQAARLGDVRAHNRSDEALRELLQKIYILGGLRLRKDEEHAETREPRAVWTTPELARAARLSERAIRAAIEGGRLPATKRGNAWLILASDALTYLERRKRT